MAKAKKLPSGNWRVQARATVFGETVTKSFTATTAAKAERLAQEWQRHCKRVGDDTTTLTVSEAIKQYIENKTNILSPTTIREYTRILNNDMTDLMDLPLYKLTCPMIQRSVNIAAEKLSAKTVKNRYSLLRHTLSVYYPEFVWSVSFPKRTKTKKRTYSHSYINQILNAVKNTDFEVETYLGLLSMRESEIGGLKWTDIDYKHKTLQINRTKLLNTDSEYVIVENTKTADSARTIYLPDYVCDILKSRQAASNSEFVTNLNPNRFRDRLNKILSKSGVEGLRFHELRHIYSSLTASLNIDKEIRMENGGWSNERIMEGTYQHVIAEEQKTANKKMNDYFNEKVHTKTHTPNAKRLRLVKFERIS